MSCRGAFALEHCLRAKATVAPQKLGRLAASIQEVVRKSTSYPANKILIDFIKKK